MTDVALNVALLACIAALAGLALYAVASWQEMRRIAIVYRDAYTHADALAEMAIAMLSDAETGQDSLENPAP